MDSKLMKGIIWARFLENDNTGIFFRTTLDQDVLLRLGVVHKNGALYDIDKKDYRVPPETCYIDLSVNKPEVREVDDYVNKFL